MSYDLCIWDTARHATLPTSADEALEIMERLSLVDDFVNPVLRQFSLDLVQHFETSVQTEPKDLQAYWGSDPRQTAAACKSAVYRLHLPSDPGIEQLAYVVAAAAKHGLVVFDDENGMCFLPDGTVYPEDMREIWKSDLADLMAGPADPQPDNRTLLQTIASELFDALGRGNKRINV